MNTKNTSLPAKESQEVEFKTSFNDDVIITLVAFANSLGGSVYVGVADSGAVKGIQVGKETLAKWLNEVKNKTVPILIPDLEEERIGNKTVAVFRVTEYPVKPVSVRGRYYKRIGNSNHQLSVSEVVDMHLQSINTSWDSYRGPEYTVDDISLDKVQKAIETMKQNHLSVTETPLSFLTKYNLLRENNLTNAAYLLFKKRDSAITTIELGRFQDEITIKDTARTKADILTQIEEVLDFVRKHINKEVIITGNAQNRQKWQYPLEAIRELVINMVVHRDYRSSSDSIIKIFDNKIEFYNPGRLPATITIEDLLTNAYRSTPRNKLLADFFKDMGLIEKYGSGIRRVINTFKEAQLPLPVFQNISDGFMVTVFSGLPKNVVENVVENEAQILGFISVNPSISALEMAEKLRLTERTVQRYLKSLQKKKLISRIGPARGGHWKISFQ